VKILLDECLPRDLRKHLVGHECQTVPQAGLSGVANGELKCRSRLAHSGRIVALTGN